MFVIYKTHSIYLMRLVGGTSVMAIDKMQVNSGLLTKNCITEFKGHHFVASDGDIVVFDGQNVESIAAKRVRNAIFSGIDSTNVENSYVVRNDTKNEVWFCYPETGATWSTVAAVWNWKDDTWTFRDLPDSRHLASGLANMVPSPTYNATTTTYNATTDFYHQYNQNSTADNIAGAATLAINQLDQTNDFDGAAMASSLEKLSMDFGDPENIKMIKSVRPRITADAGTKIYIRLGTQDHPDDQINWGNEVVYMVGTDREAYFTTKGRFISIRMRTQDTGVHWKCHGFAFDKIHCGKY